jgi:TIR domain
MNHQPVYDVFLCHNNRDKPKLRELNERLRHEFALNTFFDQSELVGGQVWAQHIELALASSRSCAICLGPNGWGPFQLENEARPALERHRTEAAFTVIPVLLPGMQPEHMMTLADFFQKTHWVDFREDWDDPVSVRKLAAAVRGEAAFPEGKPELSPLRIRFDAFRWELGRRRDSSLLYRGSDLQQAISIIAASPGSVPAETREFVARSTLAERNRRWFVRVVTAAVILTISILLFITDQRRRGEQKAREDAQSALAREKVALEKQDAALKSETIARKAAEDAQKGETEQRTRAEQQRNVAVHQRNLAYARFLIAEGERLIRTGQDRRASVFFVTALQMADSPEARGSLLSQTLKNPHLAMAGISAAAGISAIASTSQGQVAIADLKGGLSIDNLVPYQGPASTYGASRLVATFATDGADRIVSLEYSDDEHELLGLGISGRLYQWNLADATPKLDTSVPLRNIRDAVGIAEAVPQPPPFALSRQAVAVGSEGEGAAVFEIGQAPPRVTEAAKFSQSDCFGLALALDNKGDWLACYVQENGRISVRVWGLRPKKLARVIEIPSGFGAPSSIAMSGDGRFLALGYPHDLFTWQEWQDRQKQPTTPQPHEISQFGARGSRPVSYLAFSPDGTMVTSIYDRQAYLWDVASGVQLAALPNAAPAAAVTRVLVGRDLKSWLVGRGQGISVVDLNSASWAYWACIDSGGGSLTEEEWTRLLPGLPYRCTCTMAGQCTSSSRKQ